MNNTQKWLLIGAIWLIAISLFFSVLKDRYFMQEEEGSIFLLDKITGDVYVTTAGVWKEKGDYWRRLQPTKHFEDIKQIISTEELFGKKPSDKKLPKDLVDVKDNWVDVK